MTAASMLRAMGRVNGSTRSRPSRSVMKPGSTSRLPPTSTTTPSAISRAGIRPLRTACSSARHVRAPSRRISQAPSNEVATMIRNVCQPPMAWPTATMTTISRMGRSSSPTTASRVRRTRRARDGGGAAVMCGLRSCAFSHRLPATPALREGADLPQPVLETPAGDAGQGLADDVVAHLRHADLPLDEGDRPLHDRETGADRPERHVDLEAVTLGLDSVQAHRPQRLGPVDPVAGRRVIDLHAEQHLGVDVGADREDLATDRPVAYLPALDPTGADDDVGLTEGSQQGRELLRQVRAVGVHLHDGVVAALQRDGEAGEVRLAQTFLAGA